MIALLLMPPRWLKAPVNVKGGVVWTVDNTRPRRDRSNQTVNAHQRRMLWHGGRFYHVSCGWVPCREEAPTGCNNMSFGKHSAALTTTTSKNNITAYSSPTLVNDDWALEIADALPRATRAVGFYFQPNIA